LVLNWNGTSWISVHTGDGPLNSLWGRGARRVYTVGVDGWVMRWDGDTWTTLPAGTSNHLLDVWTPRNRGVVYVVGQGGTILRGVFPADFSPGGIHQVPS